MHELGFWEHKQHHISHEISLVRNWQNNYHVVSFAQPEDVRETLEKVREMEHSYGHLFDAVITNTEQEKSISELLRLIDKLDIVPQWVPSAWVS